MNIKTIKNKENFKKIILPNGKIYDTNIRPIEDQINSLVKFISSAIYNNKYFISAKELEDNLESNINVEKFWNIFLKRLSFSLNSWNMKTSKKDKIVQILLNSQQDQYIEENIEILETDAWVRRLQDMPPNILTATKFVNEVQLRFKPYKNIVIKVLTNKEIKERNLSLIESVNNGSQEEARVLIIEHIIDKSKPIVGLVGKGIIFDSGGYTLKDNHNMRAMKMDMSGAAIVSGIMELLSKNSSKNNVVGICMLTDNKIGPNGSIPQTTIENISGLTIEITNTDAEGRLVLADGISLIKKDYNPEYIIDIATLTGGVVAALGSYATAVFTNQDGYADKFINIQKKSYERMWELPVYPELISRRDLSSPIADLANSDHGAHCRSAYAASFLFAFAKETPLIHLDIAGTAVENRKRGHAVMLQSVFQYLK